MSATEVVVSELPDCDICPAGRAQYDGRTKMGPWANMCESCFKKYGVGLGYGHGQKLIVSQDKEDKQAEFAERRYG